MDNINTLLAEIALALNRLTILKTIEMKAAEFRESGFDKPSSYYKAEEELNASGFCYASYCDVVDDAENAIHDIARATDADSPAVIGASAQ